MRAFYLRKIGEHLQELAILAMVFVPLDRSNLPVRQILIILGGAGVSLILGIELERRNRE